MQKIATVLLILLLISCGKNKEKDEPGITEMIEGISDLNKIANEAKKMEEENEKLIKTSPISNDELKKMLPESLLGYPRKKFSVGNQFMPDVATGEATYENPEGNIISLSIVDGAGETGNAMISLVRLGLAMDFEEQTESGYRKSTSIEGYKAIEEVEKDEYSDDTNSKIDLIVSNRFLVSIEGQVSVNQIKKAIHQLSLDKLEDKAK